MFNLFSKQSSLAHIDGAEFEEKRQSKQAVVLDVRTKGETAQGKIPGSKLIDVMSADFRQQLEKLDRDKTYLVYCQSGARSAKACGQMHGAGFEKVFNLRGGIGAWLHR